ncbi:uncharacterized protein LTR77_005850 [Saxophila tyrrhenica]|uniref:Uncharacterized protein n=1 Tax=Saxophila tyrrhenica TaxID=1690608 RepID=A0AAV9PAA1_9PEZI|nr:hypothetical protein LTR77_005850 [Saxophila tyrrhenica]
MSSTNSANRLHWTQRIALVRHNLHAASRSGDFHFFKNLQAAGLIEGVNHIATLAEELGDDADLVSIALDNLNAGLAYVHQDAFKNAYENFKSDTRGSDDGKDSDRSKVYVDITMQKNMADMAIDKMTSSAIALINQQPENAQDAAANAWITGTTIIADCMEVALLQMDMLDAKLDDFIRMEDSWNTVRASVVCAVTGLKGVFRLMDQSSPQNSQKPSPRNSSVASASSAVFRRLSNAFASGPPSNHSRQSSVASASATMRSPSISSTGPVYRTPNYVRNSVSAGCPTSLPFHVDLERKKLSMIPPTPAVDDQADPFDTSVPPLPQMPAIEALPPMPAPVAVSVDERTMGQAV